MDIAVITPEKEIEILAVPTPQVSTSSSPNRIITIDLLKNFVNMHVGCCKLCKSTNLRLQETTVSSFACSLELICDKCEKNKAKLYNEIYYQKQIIHDKKVLTSNDVKVRKKLMRSHNASKKKYEKILTAKHERTMRPRTNEASNSNIFSFEINARAFLTAYYLGQGSTEVGFSANMMGIQGGKNWFRASYRHASRANAIILATCADIFYEALVAEVKATI